MSKYELQKLFFKKSKKLLMTSFFRSRSWSRNLPVSVSKPKLRSRPVLVSVLVSEKFYGLSLGLGLGRVGLDYSPVNLVDCKNCKGVMLVNLFCKIFSAFSKNRIECPLSIFSFVADKSDQKSLSTTNTK